MGNKVSDVLNIANISFLSVGDSDKERLKYSYNQALAKNANLFSTIDDMVNMQDDIQMVFA